LLSNEDENGEKDEEDDLFKLHDLDNCKETDNVYFDDQASHIHRYKDVGMNEIENVYSKKLEMNSAKEDIQNTQNNRSRIHINNYEKVCYTNASMKGSNQNSNLNYHKFYLKVMIMSAFPHRQVRVKHVYLKWLWDACL